jgi:prepilin peptidase CpaA
VALKPVLSLLLLLTLAVCVTTDLRARRIYDAVTLPAVVVALALRAWLEGVGSLDDGLISGLVGGGATLVLFGAFALVGRGLGWGDVKLATAGGAVFGFPLALGALLFIALVGAAQAVISLLWQGAVSDTLSAWVARARRGPRAVGSRREIPYSVAIALGSVWAMWWDR